MRRCLCADARVVVVRLQLRAALFRELSPAAACSVRRVPRLLRLLAACVAVGGRKQWAGRSRLPWARLRCHWLHAGVFHRHGATDSPGMCAALLMLRHPVAFAQASLQIVPCVPGPSGPMHCRFVLAPCSRAVGASCQVKLIQ
jgi:hypothetical protein